MMHANVLSGAGSPRPAIYVEPVESTGDAPSGRARVRVVFSFPSGVRSDVRDFESLSEALAYACSLVAGDPPPA